MKITRNNYEAFFLDYYEKTLTPEEVAELMVFLEENEDLREEFAEFEEVIFLPSDNSVEFQNKNSLKKKDISPVGKIDGNNYEEYFIASLEGDLSEREQAEVSLFLSKNPDTKLEYNAFRATFLKPGEVIFDDKESLKKRGLFVIYRSAALYAVSIAASILIFFGVYSLLTRNGKPDREFVQITGMEMIISDSKQKGIAPQEIAITKPPARTVIAKDDESKLERETMSVSRISTIEISMIDVDINSVSFIDIPAEAVSGTAYPFNPENNDTGKEIKRRSFASRFLASMVKKIIPVRSGKRKSLIEYTVTGYNMMADKDIRVEKQYDDNGNLVAYNVVGENVEITKRVRKGSKE